MGGSVNAKDKIFLSDNMVRQVNKAKWFPNDATEYTRSDLIPQWQPIVDMTDEYKDGRDVLFWIPSIKRSMVAHWLNGGFWYGTGWHGSSNSRLKNPGLWMPLSPP